jgi:hypothetical protein
LSGAKRLNGAIFRAMGPRDFDPIALGNAECDAWAAYYRRQWGPFLRSAVGMVRLGFGMPRPQTIRGAWYVLRANQVWAPYPDNDPPRAREYMRRFYALVSNGELNINPDEAAAREVEWWRVHRMHQREDALTEDDLAASLVELYSYVYSVAPDAVRKAAHHRVVAMRYSDEWVESGCELDDPLLAAERAELIASYTALLAAVRR